MCFKIKNYDNSEKLYVITPIFNPNSFKSRKKLYKRFEERMLLTPNVILCTIECLFEGQKSIVKKNGNNHIVITMHSLDKLWLKENLINIAVSKLPKEAKYISWIDADLEYHDFQWVNKTINLLKEYPVVQMFSSIDYIDNNNNKTHSNNSLIWGWNNGYSVLNGKQSCYNENLSNLEQIKKKGQGYGWHGSPGGAWAYRREIFEQLDGLIDFGIVGSGDSYSAFGMLGIVCSSLLNNSFNYNDDYVNSVKDWVKNAFEVVKGNIGLLDEKIYHNYHGETKDRQYWERNYILCRNKFSPIDSLYKNHLGLNQFNEGNDKLKEEVINYFESRKEDNNYIEENEEVNKFENFMRRIFK